MNDLDSAIARCPVASQADQLLTAYGKWAKDRHGFGRCGSAEGRYRSTDVHHGVAVPVETIADWSAQRVQRALLAVPEFDRRLLSAWYVQARGQGRTVRMLKKELNGTMAPRMVDGLRHFMQAFRAA